MTYHLSKLAAILSFVLFTLHFSLFTPVHAASLPPLPCGNLPGCGSPIENVIGLTAIPEIARILLNLTAALCIVFLLIGGAYFILGFAKEEEYTKARKTILWALTGLTIALLSDEIVTAIITEQYIGTLGGDPVLSLLHSVVRIMMTLLNIVLLLVSIGGGIRMVVARGKEEEITKARHMLIYALVGAIVINASPYVVKAVIALF